MDKKEVRVLVITGFGLNCEKETAAAFEHCGATAEKVHLNDLISGRRRLDEFQILAFIGGFAFGDHLGAGTVFANRVKFKLRDQLETFVADRKLIIGICNGFQMLSRLGVVPALRGEYFVQQAALAHNDSGLFRDDWCYLKANAKSPCVFTRNMDLVRLPIRHGEGKFVAEAATLEEIEAKNLVALRYANCDGSIAGEFPANPNGSLNAIAGICDESGRIFGLMPHPEAFLSPYNSPSWTRDKLFGRMPAEGDGVAFFRNAVEYIAEKCPVIK
ncbi:phosphoribosylformylglycinamidine synthase subunit PurQ [Victivallis sp. Marseille-Q1083]|uniref:phosphoribosylformylglycinamidine synthase subunit PurQ n=1 Tax=Victivallis sp. Marseille-Q1083 TaxID=2717288 RepID=UPI001589B4BC|nr:phosphoribosylformylglycinamidine synthase subunit PurQ [Victivallis sp. Marseille-Q1083]